ncbi:hypothetical protein [Allorhodopirellula solitaria]|uniref:Glycerophosphoryl diester phosphodiesterase membrane domain-containing protein n=1 Tax=Allorhodopirellula solitaria TaxID=2527987 RepID=A0A5C5YGA0_9BACT|nr:hypothetical protein [Allorhodopirellula solitaria]TWT74158.1 hypothetical protein CA85_10450 [Allorhodopirellula solitaria]
MSTDSSPEPRSPEAAAAATSSARRSDVVHGPEKRLFDGIRTWVDVFPWLRLVRVCRVAGGPVWVTHVLVVSLVWMWGIDWLGGSGAGPGPAWVVVPSELLPAASATMPSDAWATFPLGTFGIALDWKMMLWTVLVWIPTMMALLRVGALLTAGRDIPSYLSTFRAVGQRLRGAPVIVLLPTVVAASFWLIAWGATWSAVAIGGSSEHSTWATWLSLPIVLPATVVAALLIFAGKLAVPLGLAAAMIEPDADPIDSLSRGYEYTLRRLPQLALLVLVAAVISLVIVWAYAGLAQVGRGVALSVDPVNTSLLACLSILPSVIAVMLLWSMFGGIYLLLRQSAGGKEVEDLAIDSGHWKSPKMPSVQQPPPG